MQTDLSTELGALRRMALRRLPSKRVAQRRVAMKRRLRKLGITVAPDISTVELIALTTAFAATIRTDAA